MAHLTLDKSNYQAFKNQQQLEIDPTEFDILWILASKPHQSFSREDIEVGLSLDDPYFDNSNILLQLNGLLHKLDDPLIRMVSEGNYQLVQG